jgi:hypothetical protein
MMNVSTSTARMLQCGPIQINTLRIHLVQQQLTALRKHGNVQVSGTLYVVRTRLAARHCTYAIVDRRIYAEAA